MPGKQTVTKPYTGRDKPGWMPAPQWYIATDGTVKQYSATPDTPKPSDFVRYATYEERLANAGKAAVAPGIIIKPLPPETIGQKTTTATTVTVQTTGVKKQKKFLDAFFDGINNFLAQKNPKAKAPKTAADINRRTV